MLAAGTYRARVKDAALGKSGSGKEQIALMFEIQDEQIGGQTITYYGYFTERTYERTIESMRHCGWQGDDLLNLAGINDNEVEIVVAHEQYEGKTYAKVQWINRIGGGGGVAVKEKLQEADARQFAARMKQKIAALGAGKPAAPKSPAGSSAAEDKVPF